MHQFRLLLPLALLLLSASCAQNNPKSSAPAEKYPLPSVPSEITEPHARASVICARFWDDAVFPAEVPDSVSPALEQALANFVAIATMADNPDSVSVGISRMIEKGGLDRTMNVAERYLYDPNSPLRSEETFLLFLNQAPGWHRTEMLREEVLKNRVGTPAADFTFIDSKGRKNTLSQFVKANGQTFIYFFDSECNVCKGLIPQAARAAESMAVLAVCPEANADKFDEVLPLFPADWTVARDLGQIDADELYILPALPSVYIIAPDQTVRAKDLPLSI